MKRLHRVLILDDNEASAQTIAWLIEAFGHEAQIVTDSAQCLEAARSYKPSICMLDINVPGINGYDLCRMLRAEPGMAGVTFLAQTGWDTEHHRKLSREAGFDRHLVKPIDMKTIEAILN